MEDKEKEIILATEEIKEETLPNEMEENEPMVEDKEEVALEEDSKEEVENLVEESKEEKEEENKEDKQESTYKEMSPLKLVMRRFLRSKLSIIGVFMILFLFLFSFLGPVVYTRWGEIGDDDPVTIIVETKYEYETPDHEVVVVVKQVPIESRTNPKASPSWNHLLGTDQYGYDVFTRLMYGGRISLAIGFIVVILETIIAIILGGLAGYFGGWVDQLIMRIVDIFNCIPTLPILLIASEVIDSFHVEPGARIYWLMVIITLFGWSGTARIVRGQILGLREQEYITATEVMGLPTWRKIFKHLIPNVMPQLIVSMTLGLGSVILYESTLSYLGLGVQVPYAAWGTMISASNDATILSNYPHIWLPAGIMIIIAVLGFNFVGDGLRDAMDPRAKK